MTVRPPIGEQKRYPTLVLTLLHAPATTETDIPDPGVSVAPFPLPFPAYSRMVPR